MSWQDTKEISRFFFTFSCGWLFLGGIFFGIFMFGVISTILGIEKIVQLTKMIGGFILIFSFIILGMSLVNLFLKKISLRNIKKIKKIKNPKVAIILGSDRWQGYFISSYLGIKYLLKLLDLKKQTYTVYITPSKKEFNLLLKNSKIQVFYLIGHGSKRGFVLNKKENIFYLDYKNSKITKDEINLYHCGHSEGKTVIDYLVKKKNRKKCFIEDKKVMVISLILKFYDLYKKELQTSKNPKIQQNKEVKE